jgi:ABC-type sugar transport system permease subunit
LFLSVVGVINGLLTFGEIDLLTQGGPSNHTNVLAYGLYRTAFLDFNQGQAAAQSVLLFLIVGGVSAAQIALLRKKIHHV